MDFDAEPWDYLAASEAIDIEHPLVQAIASELRTGDDIAYARAAFDYVRDQIPHSMDTGDTRVPWRASDVLEQRTGLCFAQSHAYVALLRAAESRRACATSSAPASSMAWPPLSSTTCGFASTPATPACASRRPPTPWPIRTTRSSRRSTRPRTLRSSTL